MTAPTPMIESLVGKTILVTGGTGSFGHTMVRRALEHDFREIRIFSRDELKQDLMRNEIQDPRVKYHLGDVRDADGVDRVMRGVDFVFHAAALKQVPSCEFFPMQAVLTNIVGSHHVIEKAARHGVERVVCLSTDKAVYPVNAMGMSKAMMEKTAQAAARAFNHGDTIISCVRYGNVLCSRGSVIPLFIRQIQAGEPITVTDPEMTRFMLSLPEAIELVLFALAEADQGDLFVRKAPACTVGVLAEALKRVFASDTPVQQIGTRHGEKLFETLVSRAELTKSEDLGDYYRVRLDDRDLNYSKYFTEGSIDEMEIEDYTSHNTTRLGVDEMCELLMTLPEICRELESLP